uniref:Sodium channel modifier 1 n=1 Tax=Anolis carolinensis TaxID=28377 RepID=H9GLE9_ANOCA
MSRVGERTLVCWRQKRRVADLLANYIPEDEALLLRDGRYSCSVCFHRPVFDTLDMLTVHRSGKKHLLSRLYFCGHSGWGGWEKITQNALLKATPYNSCCRRMRNCFLSFLVSGSLKDFHLEKDSHRNKESSPKGSELTPEKRRILEHYLKLKSSGWVQDGAGKWVKDENAEFDSDEEEPPPLAPL